ncbi:hypothetical protein F5890DRAFT_1561385 [Lentinula detonsa]|uniref:Uncharacterized protein n=1 Tax=Lentinula detonsa TaxID=2804962 RepID=A0AA38UYK0_9AGAR|nr:hypothetical protein F5890DRAFT_1561385 [Lentinula detonsa]
MEPDRSVWQFRTEDKKYICRICNDGNGKKRSQCAEHERAQVHQNRLRPAGFFQAEGSELPLSSGSEPAVMTENTVIGPLMQALLEMRNPETVQLRTQRHQLIANQSDTPPPPLLPLSSDTYLQSDTELAPPPEEAFVQHLSHTFQDYLLNGILPENASDSEMSANDESADDSLVGDSDKNTDVKYRAHFHRNQEKDPHWFPWSGKITCILDIIQHLPRSTFSDRQLEVISWALRITGTPEVPSMSGMKEIQKMLDTVCGIRTLKYHGALGHIYYVNSLEDIVSREMANPIVRPKLSFYPEATNGRIDSAKNAFRWLHELDPNLTTPMIRVGNEDFYLFEPCRLRSRVYCIPYRWIERVDAEGKAQLYGWVWNIRQSSAMSGWEVFTAERVEVHESEFLTSFPKLRQSFEERLIPDPGSICGVYDKNGGFSPWRYTDPLKGNPWREKAQGHQVFAFPIWLYCDDTSGNKSKKWNKHNSFLFTAAGLDRKEAHLQFHVHFLSTSNIAPPLEMLDGIVEQLEVGEQHGIWAYDCKTQDMVLLIVSVLAMLGDNPMQSEFACHIGLMGKMFCRCCFVQGKGEDASGSTQMQAVDVETTSISSNSSAEVVNSTNRETFQDLVQRATRFFETHHRRTKEDTIQKLKTIFTHSRLIGEKTKAKKLKTAFGIKDTYQDYFTDLIFTVQKKLQGSHQQKQDEINKVLDKLPSNILRLDPHRDTPVEILHVVLLGFVKYLWRDAIARLSDVQKDLLISRLLAFNVDGLELSALAGITLVKYAGSLVGRDFRVISQAAVFVLYDLVPGECFATWRALSTLVPLVWLPVIEDMDSYLASFFHRGRPITATNWTPRWFNKPKFHVLLHLPEHIRRFGPAILFATETFESYNAVIRGFSIHSNRQAPSRDIALEFSGLNRIRHMLSGGLFQVPLEELPKDAALLTKKDFCTIGTSPMELIEKDETLRKMAGFPQHTRDQGYQIRLEAEHPTSWDKTEASQYVQDIGYSAHVWKKCTSFHLISSGRCRVDSIVVFKTSTGKAIGKVVEILQAIDDGQNIEQSRPSLVVLQAIQLKAVSLIYFMPRISLLPNFVVVTYRSILCALNSQHHCHGNNCHIARVREVREQEREKVHMTVDKYVHLNPLDMVLNTAQMRDYAQILPFTYMPPILDRSTSIKKGAEREMNAPKSSTRSKKRNRAQSLLQRAIQGSSQALGTVVQPGSHLRNEFHPDDAST